MLSEELFREVLIAPAEKQGMDRLQIVSGFATAGMADRHMERLRELAGRPVGIELIIGMPRSSGIEKAQHHALRKLARERPYDTDFSCRYVVKGSPVHAKTYCWFSGGRPATAFAGSANYTLRGFGKSQIETMASADAVAVAAFHAGIRRVTADCLSDGIEDKIVLTETRRITDRTRDAETPQTAASARAAGTPQTAAPAADTVSLTLLDSRTGETPKKSGINWGQRAGRDKNQAYVNIPADIGNSGFFPERGGQFTVLTDDGDSFIMVRAQDGGKALQTTQSNALLGAYLRKRMQVPSGGHVTRQHLVRYGRTDVTFTKIDDETYLLDFRPDTGPGGDVEIRQD